MWIKKISTLLFCLASPWLSAEFVQITSQEQYKKDVLENTHPVVVKFAADWCSVCKGIEEPFQKIAQEKEFNHITFACINIDVMDTISKQNSIVGVPTFIYLNQGKKINEEIGINNMNTFAQSLRTNIRQTFHLAQTEQTQSMEQSRTNGYMMPEKPAAPVTQPQGFFEHIIAFITQLLMQIKELFVRVFTAIKNMFRA